MQGWWLCTVHSRLCRAGGCAQFIAVYAGLVAVHSSSPFMQGWWLCTVHHRLCRAGGCAQSMIVYAGPGITASAAEGDFPHKTKWQEDYA